MQVQTSVEFAQSIKLSYVDYKSEVGISRKKKGKSYIYVGPDGDIINDKQTLDRIKHLNIPPAYTNVWISPYPNSYLQAVSKDIKGRRQYRYHTRWREYRNEFNHSRMVIFGTKLPRLRRHLHHDLSTKGLNKNKVIATVISIMDKTLIRVGNENYARENNSHGLTTLRNKHAQIKGGRVILGFRGKSKKHFKITLQDSQLAKIVKRSKELPGYNLFEYQEGSAIEKISSSDINNYLKEWAGEDFSAKDFRTWWATVYCYHRLTQIDTSQINRKKYLSETIHYVAKKLGNTPGVCKKHYIYPELLDCFEGGKLKLNTCRTASHYFTLAEKQTLLFLKKSLRSTLKLHHEK